MVFKRKKPCVCDLGTVVMILLMFAACAPDILTMNMTHTGELGYVFYIPNEFALHVYDSILEAGKAGEAAVPVVEF